MIRSLVALAVFLLALPVWSSDVLVLGVFAYRPPEILSKRYQPLADYLGDPLGGTKIELRILKQDAIEKALADNELDLVFTNPSHYVASWWRSHILGSDMRYEAFLEKAD